MEDFKHIFDNVVKVEKEGFGIGEVETTSGWIHIGEDDVISIEHFTPKREGVREFVLVERGEPYSRPSFVFHYDFSKINWYKC